MGVLERAGGLEAYLNGPSPRKTFVPSELPVLCVRDELHDDVRNAVLYLEVVDGGYIRMAQPSG